MSDPLTDFGERKYRQGFASGAFSAFLVCVVVLILCLN